MKYKRTLGILFCVFALLLLQSCGENTSEPSIAEEPEAVEMEVQTEDLSAPENEEMIAEDETVDVEGVDEIVSEPEETPKLKRPVLEYPFGGQVVSVNNVEKAQKPLRREGFDFGNAAQQVIDDLAAAGAADDEILPYLYGAMQKEFPEDCGDDDLQDIAMEIWDLYDDKSRGVWSYWIYMDPDDPTSIKEFFWATNKENGGVLMAHFPAKDGDHMPYFILPIVSLRASYSAAGFSMEHYDTTVTTELLDNYFVTFKWEEYED